MTTIIGTVGSCRSIGQLEKEFVETPHADNLDGKSRVMNVRVDEVAIPERVFRNTGSLSIRLQMHAPLARNVARLEKPTWSSENDATEPSASDLVHDAFRKSGYPLQNILCWCDEKSLLLRGTVTRYFYAQVALETALRFANGRRIDFQIETISAADRDRREFE